MNFIDLVVGKLKDMGDKAEVSKAIRTSVMSKQHGNEDFLAELIADACSKLQTLKKNHMQKKYNIIFGYLQNT